MLIQLLSWASLWLLSAGPPMPEAYQPVPVMVAADGTAAVDLPAGPDGGAYLAIVGSLALGETPHQITTTLQPIAAPRPLTAAPVRVETAWQDAVRTKRQQMQRRRAAQTNDPDHVVAKFPERRSFYLFVKEDDFLNTGNYQEVVGQLAAVGKHCLVYVDQQDSAQGAMASTVADAVATFDDRVFPLARKCFGNHLDVDRNGKFTILFTHWLGNLSNGKVSLGGFVRGADLYRDVDSPFSNHCDMLYLNSNLQPGPNLRTILAHEYTHAITFSEHVFGNYLSAPAGLDEDAWLSEAVAHLAENLAGFGWSNLDYRISAYLTAPERYRLVVPDYYRAGLWRCHGSRGSTYLFLRWCVDRFGTALLRELTQSSLNGLANIETAAQTPFAELFRAWTVATCLSGLGAEANARVGPAFVDFYGRLETRQLAGARWRTLTPGQAEWTVAATAMIPLRVQVPPQTALRLLVEAAPSANLQVTIVRLPEELPLTELTVVPAADHVPASRCRLQLHHLAGSGVLWEHLSWERAFPPQTKSPDYLGKAYHLSAEEIMEHPASVAGQTLLTDLIDLKGLERTTVVFKLLGTDSSGRRVAAWALAGPEQ